ncbi:MAG: hypothetical protein PF447_15215 [Spirochaetaceae bacterium]|nr:hypothetical protein [Spirochaetaceae bacterium]
MDSPKEQIIVLANSFRRGRFSYENLSIESGEIEIKLTNAHGDVLFIDQGLTENSSQRNKFSLRNLDAGEYILSISGMNNPRGYVEFHWEFW